jgi:hypothetical protein
MTKGKNQHVVPHAGDWAVKGAKNARATVVVPTQKQAIGIGRGIAQNEGSELFIHNRQGQIRERDSHGSDPRRSKG